MQLWTKLLTSLYTVHSESLPVLWKKLVLFCVQYKASDSQSTDCGQAVDIRSKDESSIYAYLWHLAPKQGWVTLFGLPCPWRRSFPSLPWSSLSHQLHHLIGWGSSVQGCQEKSGWIWLHGSQTHCPLTLGCQQVLAAALGLHWGAVIGLRLSLACHDWIVYFQSAFDWLVMERKLRGLGCSNMLCLSVSETANRQLKRERKGDTKECESLSCTFLLVI